MIEQGLFYMPLQPQDEMLVTGQLDRLDHPIGSPRAGSQAPVSYTHLTLPTKA